MKWKLSILMLTIYFLSTTQMIELIKLPLLIKHYVQHKEENKKINIFQFLKIHYVNKQIKDKDYEEDMKLPFKTCNSPLQISFISERPTTLILFNEINFHENKKSEINFYKNNFYSNLAENNIFQPPRFI